MDKSYIIRIYEKENKSVMGVMGVMEDIEQNKRFSSVTQMSFGRLLLITGRDIPIPIRIRRIVYV